MFPERPPAFASVFPICGMGMMAPSPFLLSCPPKSVFIQAYMYPNTRAHKYAHRCTCTQSQKVGTVLPAALVCLFLFWIQSLGTKRSLGRFLGFGARTGRYRPWKDLGKIRQLQGKEGTFLQGFEYREGGVTRKQGLKDCSLWSGPLLVLTVFREIINFGQVFH